MLRALVAGWSPVAPSLGAPLCPLNPFDAVMDPAPPDFRPERGAERLFRLPASRLAALADALRVPDGGFTLDPATGAAIESGYVVSVHPDRERVFDRPVTGADLAAYIADMVQVLARPGRAFGGWHDPDSGRAHLDVSVVVASLADAMTLGRAAGQLAVFDLDTGQSIPIPDTDATVIPFRRRASAGIPGGSQPETIGKDRRSAAPCPSGPADIDPESWEYWTQQVSALPEMTSEEIAAVATILRRIDARRGTQQPPSAQQPPQAA